MNNWFCRCKDKRIAMKKPKKDLRKNYANVCIKFAQGGKTYKNMYLKRVYKGFPVRERSIMGENLFIKT